MQLVIDSYLVRGRMPQRSRLRLQSQQMLISEDKRQAGNYSQYQGDAHQDHYGAKTVEFHIAIP